MRDLNSPISRRDIPYLDLNWRDIRIDELVLRYPLYRTSNLVVAKPKLGHALTKTLEGKILKKRP
jgi:hypothetical protein